MAKDKKAKAAQKKARVAAKVEKKAVQKDKKTKAKPSATQDSSDDETDLDAILATFAAQQALHLKVTETVLASPPPPRSSATLLSNPSDARELLLFGGEALRNGLASFSNELIIYRPATDQWRQVTSPNSPLPRSGHAWCRGANNHLVYLFGGEFSSPKQGTFHHYNDFWALDAGSREWTRLEGKTGPSARSGHRMVGFKRYVLLFGGFQDTSASTRYLNDLWVYDTQTYTWFEPKVSQVAQRPDARSSFSFLPCEAGAVIVGGYSRVKATTQVGGRKKGGGGGSKVTMRPMVHTDCWLLRITEPAKEEGERALPTIRWERRKKPVNYPNPPRAGATMAHHKGRGILFGGVHDVEESEEGIESEFFNQLWALNIDRNRFFPLSLRKPRQGQKKTVTQDRSRRGRGKADEEELLKNLKLIENKGSLDDDDQDMVDSVQDGSARVDEEEATAIEKPVVYEMPHPRFNAQLAVQDDTLFIYGGTFEKGDLEFQMDELWAIDLGKMDGAKEIFRRELEGWGADESSEDEDDEEEDEEDSEDEAGDAEGSVKAEESSTAEKQAAETAAADIQEPEEEQEREIKTSKDDGLPYPRPFESLREFYARTTNDWQNITITQSQIGASAFAEQKSAKEIKKEAFERSEQRWWDVREEIQALEDEREEGGIGEVVQLGDRAAEGGGPRRR
ncbi:Kelch repeat-containing protein 3 [Sphaceloma murrayae]|uniref:Kelch repeat-containing protein 3 n=1 Tax=Sphaceloma murrayae TaxID=2082308 RepID=A0A2K1R228_9PEZI|nr:Kelch repeat-containing protein 3 [Sphaceloma murrayae]